MYGWRFAEAADRITVAVTIADTAQQWLVDLTPEAGLHATARLTNVDGTSAAIATTPLE